MKNKINSFNEYIATQITLKVGTMWSAYLFTVMILFAIIYPPAQTIIFFISSAFLQLVFLPIIMVGGDVQSRATQKLIQRIDDNTMQELSKQNDEFDRIKELISLIQDEQAFAMETRLENKDKLDSIISMLNK